MTNDEIEKVFGHRINAPDEWIMTGRRLGKSEYTNAAIVFLQKQVERVIEYKDKNYTCVYMDHVVNNGSPPTIRLDMTAWCHANCYGHFYVAGNLFMFEQNNDAVAFALAW